MGREKNETANMKPAFTPSSRFFCCETMARRNKSASPSCSSIYEALRKKLRDDVPTLRSSSALERIQLPLTVLTEPFEMLKAP